MSIDEQIIAHLNQYDDYDIRRTRNGRFTDQKVTPDVLSTVADCVLNYVGQNLQKEFSRVDLQRCDYTKNCISMLFGKPDTDKPSAASEYDKFFSQPLLALSYSHVLIANKKGNTWYFRVDNYNLLEYISTKDFFAFNFLSHYLEKILSESGFLRHIERYRLLYQNGSLNSSTFNELKQRWGRFLTGNTEINGLTESHRIFPKVLNIFAVKYRLPGTAKGRLTDYIFTFNDLLYNRLNWRDIGKDKGLTRKEALSTRRQQLAEEYRIQKAMRIIRDKYSQSELHDQWANGEAICVHHIFPRNDFPGISAYHENLIKLTVQQHMEKAHISHNTSAIDKNYQLDCLMAKSLSIQSSLELTEVIYSKDDFIYVINEGLNTAWPETLVFDEIRSKLIEHWSMSA